MGHVEAVAQGESVEASVARIHDSESVFSSLYLHERPCLAVHYDCISEILWLPLGMDGGVVACGVHVNRPVWSKAPVEDYKDTVIFGAGRKAEVLFHLGIPNNISADEARQEINSG